MANVYQPLTEEAKRLKGKLSFCVRYAAWIADLEEERRDIAGMGFAEEAAMTEQIRTWRQDWEKRRKEAADLISRTETLTSFERRILRLRYLCAAPWDSVCRQVRRERGAVYTAYRHALNKLAKAEQSGSGLPPAA